MAVALAKGCAKAQGGAPWFWRRNPMQSSLSMVDWAQVDEMEIVPRPTVRQAIPSPSDRAGA